MKHPILLLLGNKEILLHNKLVILYKIRERKVKTLIEKDGRVRRNISIKFTCVYMCLSYGDLFNFW
jgi:hypothetical protein